MGDTVRITLPSAPPELYLRAVRWGRQAVDYATSAALPGRIPKNRRGIDPVLDLVLHDSPESIETQAQRALDEGLQEVAPVLEIAQALLRPALERGELIWKSLQLMLRYGGPPVDDDVVDLRARSRARTEQALAEAG